MGFAVYFPWNINRHVFPDKENHSFMLQPWSSHIKAQSVSMHNVGLQWMFPTVVTCSEFTGCRNWSKTDGTLPHGRSYQAIAENSTPTCIKNVPQYQPTKCPSCSQYNILPHKMSWYCSPASHFYASPVLLCWLAQESGFQSFANMHIHPI